MKIQNIKLGELQANYALNVRFEHNYGDIASLADNIEIKGLLVPLTVEKTADGYAVISGHRRFAALNLLVERGLLKADQNVPCIVDKYEDDISRVAAKLLANDGQPLTPDEWAAEIGRLAADGHSVKAIAAALGKQETYVSTMKTTWERMNEAAREAIKTGKVSMSLAIVMSRKAITPALASLGVSIAAAVKENVAASGELVSDKVLGEAVIKTTEKLMDNAKKGVAMPGSAIGADIMANIGIIKAANKAATVARADAMENKPVVVEAKPVQTLTSYMGGLVDAMDKDGFNKMLPTADVLNTVMVCYSDGVSFLDCITKLIALSKAKV